MTSRIDLRSIAEAIAEHADAITAYATDSSLPQDVVKAETLGRAYLIEARLSRLRQAVHTETVSDEAMRELRAELQRQVEFAKSTAAIEKGAMRKHVGFEGERDEEDA